MKISDVYLIKNKLNGHVYIGSSYDMKKRMNQHRNSLRASRHGNQILQNSWNKNGEESFEFIIVDICDLNKEIILEREQHFIDTLKPHYNIKPHAMSNLGYKHSEATKTKMSKSAVGKPKSSNTKKKIKEKRKFQIISKWTDEQKAKQSKNSPKRKNRGLTYQDIYGPEKAVEIKSKQSVAMTKKRQNENTAVLAKRLESHKLCWVKKMASVYKTIFQMIDNGKRICEIITECGFKADTVRRGIKERKNIEQLLNKVKISVS